MIHLYITGLEICFVSVFAINLYETQLSAEDCSLENIIAKQGDLEVNGHRC